MPSGAIGRAGPAAARGRRPPAAACAAGRKTDQKKTQGSADRRHQRGQRRPARRPAPAARGRARWEGRRGPGRRSSAQQPEAGSAAGVGPSSGRAMLSGARPRLGPARPTSGGRMPPRPKSNSRTMSSRSSRANSSTSGTPLLGAAHDADRQAGGEGVGLGAGDHALAHPAAATPSGQCCRRGRAPLVPTMIGARPAAFQRHRNAAVHVGGQQHPGGAGADLGDPARPGRVRPARSGPCAGCGSGPAASSTARA